MQAHSPESGWLIIIFYGLILTFLILIGTKKETTADEHLLANRQVSVWAGAFSIAVTWIWAPAIFICSQKSYELGLTGIFWFTFPNILCFFTFVPVALRIRKCIPEGYSLPDYIWKRFNGDRKTHLAFTLVSGGYTASAMVINPLAGGLLLNTICGMNLIAGIIALSLIAFLYSAWRGLPASVVTDVTQMIIILFLALVIIPWTIMESGSIDTVIDGIKGINGSVNIFNPWIFYSFGIPMTLGLISGPIIDQMFHQRVMSCNYKSISKTFIYGGLLFGIVPIILSIPGFIAANPNLKDQILVNDPQLVALSVVNHYLPSWTLSAFTIMVICGLSSTLDSAYCAIGSLSSIDIYQRYINPYATDKQLILASKLGMLIVGILSTSIALIPGLKLIWCFLIYGTLSSTAMIPTLFAVFSNKIKTKTIFLSILTSFVICLPLSIYANFSENPHLIVAASVLSVSIGLVFCLSEKIYDRFFSIDYGAPKLTD